MSHTKSDRYNDVQTGRKYASKKKHSLAQLGYRRAQFFYRGQPFLRDILVD